MAKEFEKHNYISWSVKSPDEYDWNDVSYDGYGYVIIDGHRYDTTESNYKEEREEWNAKHSK